MMDRVLLFVAYAYLLRVPFGIWLVLTLLPIFALRTGSGFAPLLRGVFDLSYATPPEVGFAFCFAVLSACMLAASLVITSRLILLDSHERSGVPQIPQRPALEVTVRVMALLMVLSLTAGMVMQTAPFSSWKPILLGIIIGAILFYMIMVGYHPLVLSFADRNALPRGLPAKAEAQVLFISLIAKPFLLLSSRLARASPQGFLVNGTQDLKPRHKYAVVQVVFSLLLYSLLFFLGPSQPTIPLVLIVIMMLCWIFSALTFFFDRFRIPLLGLIILYTTLMSFLPMTDSFYPSIEKPAQSGAPLGPADVLRLHAGKPVIVVAAAGGGIQAAAWTARVLSGLHQDLQDRDFDQSVALLSGVSGGSVGIMYYADAYQPDGRLPAIPATERPENRLDYYGPVAAAEASSLEAVSYGLTYPDLVWTFVPFLKGIWLKPFYLVNGPNLFKHRGTLLERAWKRTEGLKTATLAGWTSDTRAGRRPAVVFNATLVETGERLTLSTTSLDNSANAADHPPGCRYFQELYPSADLPIVTAARLSATFPYVSPASRIWRGGIFTKDYHVVDGGYYDNYGTATLLDWLDRGLLAAGPKPSKILILAIRSFPETAGAPPPGSRGFLFELTNPLSTLYNVRGAGQLSRAATDLQFVERYTGYGVPVTSVVFGYAVTENGRPVEEPLSWHLTPLDKKRLHDAWNLAAVQQARQTVRQFLSQ